MGKRYSVRETLRRKVVSVLIGGPFFLGHIFQSKMFNIRLNHCQLSGLPSSEVNILTRQSNFRDYQRPMI
jgi:hypothetical protein